MISAAGKFYTLVEGYGDVDAAHNLLTRLGNEFGIATPWARPLRWPNIINWNPTRQGYGGLHKGLEFIRGKKDAAGLLILRDAEDECPKESAPGIAAQIQAQGLPFKTAVALLKPEYEVLFLPCMHRMQGIGFPPEVKWNDDWEAHRDVKGWLGRQLPEGKIYKPAVNQKKMTQRIDLDELAAANVPCFGSLTRVIRFLGANNSTANVYPPIP